MIWFLLICLTVLILTICISLYKRRQAFYKLQAIQRGVEPTFIKVRDQTIHYHQSGRGEDILLVHGFSASLYAWRLVIKDLSKHYRVTALDLPGFGRSSKSGKFSYTLEDYSQLLNEIMDQLQINKAVFVGSSMGGTVSMHFSLQYPDKTKGLVLLSPYCFPHSAVFDLFLFSFLGRVLYWLASPWLVKTLLAKVFSKKELISDDVVLNYLFPYLDQGSGAIALLKSFRVLRDKRMPMIFKSITTPTLILWGEKDQVLSVRQLYELKPILPTHVRTEVHTQAGHHPMEDEPQWVIKSITDFQKQI